MAKAAINYQANCYGVWLVVVYMQPSWRETVKGLADGIIALAGAPAKGKLTPSNEHCCNHCVLLVFMQLSAQLFCWRLLHCCHSRQMQRCRCKQICMHITDICICLPRSTAYDVICHRPLSCCTSASHGILTLVYCFCLHAGQEEGQMRASCSLDLALRLLQLLLNAGAHADAMIWVNGLNHPASPTWEPSGL